MTKAKLSIIFLGDIAVFYGSLVFVLLVRYGLESFSVSFLGHFLPFSLILFVWLAIFYLADLYQIRTLRNRDVLMKSFLPAIIAAALVSIAFFYIFAGFFNISPKINLLLLVIVFAFFDYNWRSFIISRFSIWQTNLLILGSSDAAEETVSFLKENPQIGYRPKVWKKELEENGFEPFSKFILENKIETLAVPSVFDGDKEFAKIIYRLLPSGIEIISLRDFYEIVFRKISFGEVDESWFVREIKTAHRIYDTCKRVFDLILSPILIVVFLPVLLVCIFLVKISSKGPAVYAHKRAGKNGKAFVLYKLRTMENGEVGPLWTEADDPRVTKIGKFLRNTHLDEIPQLFNILKGDISFVGPRPESVELANLYGQLPYYEIRHIVKPGLAGWAQLNYKPSASLDEASEKLKYDIYYIKNRSLLLDILIILKTARMFFISPK